jgi:hypothetical protein
MEAIKVVVVRDSGVDKTNLLINYSGADTNFKLNQAF